jgi:hypothetical protein
MRNSVILFKTLFENMKKYVKGKKLKYSGFKVVITAVNPDGTATIHYSAGQERNGFAGTLPSLNPTIKTASGATITDIVKTGNGDTVDEYNASTEHPAELKAVTTVQELGFYNAEKLVALEEDSPDEAQFWQDKSNTAANHFVDNFIEADSSIRKNILGMLTEHGQQSIIEHADPEKANMFVALQHVSDYELKSMVDTYIYAEDWALVDADEADDAIFMEGSPEREYIKGKIVSLIASDPDGFEKLVQKHQTGKKTPRRDALNSVAADFFLKNFN